MGDLWQLQRWTHECQHLRWKRLGTRSQNYVTPPPLKPSQSLSYSVTCHFGGQAFSSAVAFFRICSFGAQVKSNEHMLLGARMLLGTKSITTGSILAASSRVSPLEGCTASTSLRGSKGHHLVPNYFPPSERFFSLRMLVKHATPAGQKKTHNKTSSISSLGVGGHLSLKPGIQFFVFETSSGKPRKATVGIPLRLSLGTQTHRETVSLDIIKFFCLIK